MSRHASGSAASAAPRSAGYLRPGSVFPASAAAQLGTRGGPPNTHAPVTTASGDFRNTLTATTSDIRHTGAAPTRRPAPVTIAILRYDRRGSAMGQCRGRRLCDNLRCRIDGVERAIDHGIIVLCGHKPCTALERAYAAFDERGCKPDIPSPIDAERVAIILNG
jgi:hypothetical protein